MCGICGIVDLSGAPVERSLVARMCATLTHRGPDNEGIHCAPFIGLGQRRLSVIDLRASATAPLANEDGTVWVVFNGEIYNFVELREGLEKQGHVFQTATDTEVIVHLYEQYGAACVRHMRGMFAFALWDEKRQALFGARDRFGKKPFCYAKTPSGIVFGSEIKSITAHPAISIAPDFFAIDQYLTFQYVPSPLTAFQGIRKLPPAHTLLYKRDGTLEIERYWEPPAPQKSSAGREELEKDLLDKLEESVRLRMVADVPVGAFLSGGIDSSTVVALMARLSSRPVKTFSIGFAEHDFDERPYARIVAKRYGTDHQEFLVRPDAAEALPLLVRHYNEPFADSSALASYYLARMTRERVTVALSGDGGDENFAGYDTYGAMLRLTAADGVPRLLRRAVAGTASRLLDNMPHHRTLARASRTCQMVAGELPERFHLFVSILKPQEKSASYTPRLQACISESQSSYEQLTRLQWDASMDPLDWMMRHDQRHYLPDCLMVKTDIASMANSLEVRCPLLDHELAELAATIPTAMKRDRNGSKQILKSAVAHLLPPEILVKRKSGFGVPVARWLRKDLRHVMRDLLLGDRSVRRGLFDNRFIATMVQEHEECKRDWSTRLWALLLLELWFREFVD